MEPTTNLQIQKPAPSDGNNIPTIADGFDAFDRAVAGSADIVVTSGAATLTAAQFATGILNFTGTPAGPATAEVGAGATMKWTAHNDTAEVVTFKTDDVGSTGIDVQPGTTVNCYSDGAEIWLSGTAVDTADFLQSANNLSDLDDASDARDNLGLGTAAVKDAGAANGVADLDGSGKVPSAQLPASVVGSLNYQGTWNANTNSPALATGVGTKGHYYKVGTAGTTSIDGESDWNVGDVIAFNGTTWDKIDNTEKDHGHTSAGDGGTLAVPVFALQGGNPSNPSAGLFKLFTKDDGTGTPRIYGLNDDGDLFDLTAVITSFLGLADVPNSYTGKAGMRVLVKADESGVDFYNSLQASKTANYTLTDGDEEILANASGGAFTVTLPTAVGRAGKQYLIKKTDSSDNIVTIATTSTQTIDGRSGRKLATQYSYTRVISDGANWIEVAAETPGMVPLTDGANIAVDCLVFPLRGGKAKVTLGGNRTLDAATGMANGMVLWVQWKQDATGSRTITHNAAYIGSTDVPLPTLSTAANTVDEVAYKYDATAAKWRTMAVNKGFAS